MCRLFRCEIFILQHSPIQLPEKISVHLEDRQRQDRFLQHFNDMTIEELKFVVRFMESHIFNSHHVRVSYSD